MTKDEITKAIKSFRSQYLLDLNYPLKSQRDHYLHELVSNALYNPVDLDSSLRSETARDFAIAEIYDRDKWESADPFHITYFSTKFTQEIINKGVVVNRLLVTLEYLSPSEVKVILLFNAWGDAPSLSPGALNFFDL